MILAEESKDKMDWAVMQLGEAGAGLKVVTREGAPHCVRDLEAVSAARARTVILLHPENSKVLALGARSCCCLRVGVCAGRAG